MAIVKKLNKSFDEKFEKFEIWFAKFADKIF